MALRAELTNVVAKQQLTGLLQQLIASRQHSPVERLYCTCSGEREPSAFTGSTAFNDVTFVFTECGIYADLPTLLALLGEITAQTRATADKPIPLTVG